jgi:hypothetical protein
MGSHDMLRGTSPTVVAANWLRAPFGTSRAPDKKARQKNKGTEKCLLLRHAEWPTQAELSFFCPFIFLSNVFLLRHARPQNLFHLSGESTKPLNGQDTLKICVHSRSFAAYLS